LKIYFLPLSPALSRGEREATSGGGDAGARRDYRSVTIPKVLQLYMGGKKIIRGGKV